MLADAPDETEDTRTAIIPSRPASLITKAAAILSARKRRIQVFGTSMFGEPAWDMLLTLYIAEKSGLRLSLNRITERSGAPASTALRWLEYLVNQHLVRPELQPSDSQASFVTLTDKAWDLMKQYLTETSCDPIAQE